MRKTVLAGVLSAFTFGALPVWGQSTCVVDRLTDSGGGAGLRGDLRYCLTQAMSGDTIAFEVTGTINLTGALPELTRSVRIEGPGSDLLTVRRDSGGDYRIFAVTGTPAIMISGLTIANGRAAKGGGIHVAGGTLTLSEITLSDNQAVGADRQYGDRQTGRGGALYVAGGDVAIVDSLLSHNQAIGGRGDDPLYCSSSGGFGGLSGGGGIYVAGGTVDVHRSTLFANYSRGGDGTDALDCSDVPGGLGGGGGPGDGGGIYAEGGTVSVRNTTLSNNQAGGGNGGRGGSSTFSDGGDGGDGGPGEGGGIYVSGGAIEVFQNTLSANQTLGGNRGFGGGSRKGIPGRGGDPGGGLGGGLAIFNGAVQVQHSTLSNNQATGGGLFPPRGRSIGGGLLVRIGRLRTRNTILAGNAAQTDAPDHSGDLGSLGHNLIGNATGGSGFDKTDLLNVDPGLGPLQDNGGPTFTHALLPDSPAIDAGDNTDAPEFDQRGEGFPRIVNDIIDIGALEVQQGQ